MASDLYPSPQTSLVYYGRSCFEIQFAGKRIVIDPFNPDVFEYASQDRKYSLPKNKIDYAFATHFAPDHSFFEGIDADRTYFACGDRPEFVRNIRGETVQVGGVVVHDFNSRSFSFWTVPSFHDDWQGALEGVNGIICLDFNGLKVVHLGDVGHTLSQEQVDDIGAVDVLMVPVDEYYTIDAETGKKIVEQLDPKIVIPMHYKTDNLAKELPFSDEKNFVSKFGKVSVHDKCCLSINKEDLRDELRIIVMKYHRD
ncbi:MAG: MBL fold metallo-hydrolase [Candidatus Bathyarchaeota archaeon]|nr:MAG: MBL fold metallo-hydrolase [Candidatus Bathyarchaeota archaeon]